MPPVTRVWHAIDVGVGVWAVKKEPSALNVARLAFALVGLAGNVVISRKQLASTEITIEGVKYRRVDDELSMFLSRK